MNVDAYLDHIHYHAPRTPTAEALRRLHVEHLRAVPFENLSIHWGEPIVLYDEALFEKVVMCRRGGFCYELNGLFGALLCELGFEVAMLSAGVYRGDGTFSPEFDHMALRVDLDEPWLGGRGVRGLLPRAAAAGLARGAGGGTLAAKAGGLLAGACPSSLLVEEPSTIAHY